MVTNNPTKFVKFRSAVAEELRPQDVPIGNNVKNEQSPITPIKIVESKWQFSMINYTW